MRYSLFLPPRFLNISRADTRPTSASRHVQAPFLDHLESPLEVPPLLRAHDLDRLVDRDQLAKASFLGPLLLDGRDVQGEEEHAHEGVLRGIERGAGGRGCRRGGGRRGLGLGKGRHRGRPGGLLRVRVGTRRRGRARRGRDAVGKGRERDGAVLDPRGLARALPLLARRAAGGVPALLRGRRRRAAGDLVEPALLGLVRLVVDGVEATAEAADEAGLLVGLARGALLLRLVGVPPALG